MAIIVIARGLIDSSVIEPTSNRPKSILMAPFLYLTNATLNNQAEYDIEKFAATATALTQQYGFLGNFTNSTLLL